MLKPRSELYLLQKGNQKTPITLEKISERKNSNTGKYLAENTPALSKGCTKSVLIKNFSTVNENLIELGTSASGGCHPEGTGQAGGLKWPS